jgi:hypothetical protein
VQLTDIVAHNAYRLNLQLPSRVSRLVARLETTGRLRHQLTPAAAAAVCAGSSLLWLRAVAADCRNACRQAAWPYDLVDTDGRLCGSIMVTAENHRDYCLVALTVHAYFPHQQLYRRCEIIQL